MKRTVLFVGNESPLNDEFDDFIVNHKGHALFSNTLEQSIQALDSHSIDMVVLTLHKLEDASILNYINKFHPAIQVLISTNKEYDELISTLIRGRYSIVKFPLKLEELNSFI
jgi:DNA-binding NtrC family response regulator